MKTNDHNLFITLSDVAKNILHRLSIDHKLSPSEIIDVLIAGNDKGLEEVYEMLFIGRKFEKLEDSQAMIEEHIFSLEESNLQNRSLESLLTCRGAVLHF